MTNIERPAYDAAIPFGLTPKCKASPTGKYLIRCWTSGVSPLPVFTTILRNTISDAGVVRVE